MSADTLYHRLPRPGRGLPHRYGDRLYVHAYPYPLSLLGRLCSPETRQPLFNQLLRSLYGFLLGQVASIELSTSLARHPTRMAEHDPEAVLEYERIEPSQQVVVVDIARAGMVPAQLFFDGLHQLLDPDALRQDHVFMNRAVNERGEVVGVDLAGSKIGGPVAGRTVIVPDPMAATGSSLLATIELYRRQPGGPPARFVAVHLIAAPEYLQRVLAAEPSLTVHVLRVDRGLSAPEVLGTPLGEHPELERGLDAHDYIVPGGGGFGELINNALE